MVFAEGVQTDAGWSFTARSPTDLNHRGSRSALLYSPHIKLMYFRLSYTGHYEESYCYRYVIASRLHECEYSWQYGRSRL